MKVVSFGAGVQSTTLLLMALEGKFGDLPDCAVFADTGWEPQWVYDWLDKIAAKVKPFKIVRVGEKNIRDVSRKPFVPLPAYTTKGGLGIRQCTDKYKLQPIRKWARSLGATRENPFEFWIGISTDEVMRMKPSRVQYIRNVYPLIDELLSWADCAEYLKRTVGRIPYKSSCIGCPFHDDTYWSMLRKESPSEFQDACAFDEEIRHRPGVTQFLHPSLKPLSSIKEFKHENQIRMFIDAFGNECEGMCGL